MGSLVFCQVSALFVTFCPREHNVVLYRMVSSIPMQCREIVLSVDVRAYFSQHTLWSLFVITGCVPFCNMMYDILLKGFKVKAFILKISLSGASHYNYFLHSTWSMPLKITSTKKQLYTEGYLWECMEKGTPPWSWNGNSSACLHSHYWWFVDGHLALSP